MRGARLGVLAEEVRLERDARGGGRRLVGGPEVAVAQVLDVLLAVRVVARDLDDGVDALHAAAGPDLPAPGDLLERPERRVEAPAVEAVDARLDERPVVLDAREAARQDPEGRQALDGLGDAVGHGGFPLERESTPARGLK